MKKIEITHLFVDIGGVLLTNGWDRHCRRRASEHFQFDFSEVEERHHLTFEAHEADKLTLDQYLDLILFYKKQSFTRAEFKEFMFAQSQAFPQMLDLIKELKLRYQLKVCVVSNEARELNEYRIEKFKLCDFVDFFISSSFVHLRKPEVEIFQLALDIAQVKPDRVLYIENTQMFVDIAQNLGICTLLHTDYASTCSKLEAFGLSLGELQPLKKSKL